ncbi:protein kinase [Capnocytophaga cynodegmi]|uniref:protein kinase domain-containing protein n=1 Tax=Capnocytophaga cynodegmi TaxID=28189 RepID=UPI0037D86F92
MNDSSVDPRIRKFLSNQKDIQIDRYSSKGGFGELYFGQRKILGDRVALKFYNAKDGSGHEEAVLLKTITHENILPIYDARMIDDEISFYLTPEMDGGDLQNIIDSYIINTNIAIEIISNILKALTELHKNGNSLVHRDLKPDNVLVDLKDGVKTYLSDFGTIRKLPNNQDYVSASTFSFFYRPCEALKNKYYKESDIYQVGIILFQILGGDFPVKEPYKWLNSKELKKIESLSSDDEKYDYLTSILNNLIVKGKLLNIDSLPIYINKKLKSIIKKATSIDYQRRYSSTSEFLKALFDYQKTAKIWWKEDQIIFAFCPKSKMNYKIFQNKKNYILQCSKDNNNWRKKKEGCLKELIKTIEQK